LKEKVLNDMYVLLMGKTSVDDEVDIGGEDDGEDVANDGKRPAGWFFHGWMAFLLYGPLAPVSQRIPLLEVYVSLGDNKTSSGRVAQRKQGAQDKATEWKNDTDGHRGLTLEQQLGLDNLKCRQDERVDTKKETKLIALNMRAHGIGTDIERAENIALRLCPVYDKQTEFWQCVIVLEEENNLVKESIISVWESPNSKFTSPKSSSKRLSVVDLFNGSRGNDDQSSCKKTRVDSLPVAHGSYTSNSSASNSSGLTPGPVEQVDDTVTTETSEELIDVASSLLGIDNC
jgi:hypothetical protein